jgi:predicted enzyme related to lactoylglutathione lyase
VIITHGWPGSVIELLDTVGPLTDRLADTWPVKCRTVDRNGGSFTFESSFQLNQVKGLPAGGGRNRQLRHCFPPAREPGRFSRGAAQPAVVSRGFLQRLNENNEKSRPNYLEPKGDPMEMKLELVPIPVTDIDRAKTFYVERLGFVEDVDVQPAAGVRVVQLTPAGSACSIGMGTGLPAYDEMAPGTIKGLHLVVADIEQARAELVGRGVEVGAVEDVGGGVKYAWLADPDGNTLTLQEMSWRTGDKF